MSLDFIHIHIIHATLSKKFSIKQSSRYVFKNIGMFFVLLYLFEIYKKLESTISIEFSYTKDFSVFKYFRMLAFDRKLFAKDTIYIVIYYHLLSIIIMHGTNDM